MNKEDAIRFAGLMEDYLNIPSFVCEMIQQQLEHEKYKEVIEYIIQRRNEIENKDDYISEQEAINMWINKLKEKDKEIERLNNIINELEKDIDLELYKTRANDEYNNGLFNAFRYVKDTLDKLKELKESK